METKMATKRQTFALFCITKKDYRNENLTYEQASNLIKELGDPTYTKKAVVNKKAEKYNDAARIMEEAIQAGKDAMSLARPTPMVVQQHANILNDNSPVTKSWVVEGGVCGFASIKFKVNTPANRKFMSGLKRAGMLAADVNDFNDKVLWRKSVYAGYSYYISEGGQSLERKEAYAYAFNKVLNNNGITARVDSRMD